MSSAEVILDGSLGQAGSLSGPNFQIEQAFGQQRGNNLFQSFSQLNINNGERAHFTADASVDNIISRVTGGDPSHINGLLRADATLYFMNPAGVIFGPDSHIDIAGSLHLTTADYLRLGETDLFFPSLAAIAL